MSNGLKRVEGLYNDRGQRARELKTEGRGIIGYLCTFTPVELITAAGLVPFRITGGRQETITMAGPHLETIACPLTRSMLDVALKDGYEFFDGFVMPHACDNIVKLYDIWSQNVEHAYGHFVNVPHTTSKSSRAFFEKELNLFKLSLERFTEKMITDAALEEAIRSHNEQRALMQQVYDFRKKDQPLVSGSEAMKIAVAVLSLPVDEANELLKSVISEIKNRTIEKKKTNGARLMIHGSGIDNTSFIELIEEAGADVVVDDYCFGTRTFFLDVQITEDHIASLAKTYLEDINCPRTYRQSPGTHSEDLDNRFGHIGKLASDFNVKGVIFHIMQYCDTHAFDVPDVKEYVEGKGLPVLNIEEDYPISSLARLKTRVEAFLETIE
jgi:benzoyl-CoA reductase subunit C